MIVSRQSDAFSPIVERLKNKAAHASWAGDDSMTRKFSNGYVVVAKQVNSAAYNCRHEVLVYSPTPVRPGSHLLAIGPMMSYEALKQTQLIVEYFTEAMSHLIAIGRLRTVRGKAGICHLYDDRAEMVNLL